MRNYLSFLLLLITSFTFSAPTTWNGSTWSNGVPTSNDAAIINGNYTVNSSTGILNCKSLEIKGTSIFTITTGYYINIWSQGLTNLESGVVIFQSGADILLRNGGGDIKNLIASNFIVEDGGSIVQLLGNTTNTGNITIKRKTNPVKSFEYTYWSTPVSITNTNTLPPSTTNNSVFTYTYPTPLPMDGWITEPTNGNMIIGKGYAVRGPWCSPYPSCFGTLPQNIYEMSFIGVPNNGTINITSNSTNDLHLIGNPYPSGVVANYFMYDNPSISAIYFWTHNTVLSGSISGNWLYNFTADDYATWNLTGGVSASSPIMDSTPNNTNVPSGNIGSCQGIFVRTNTNGPKTFTFRNEQRGLLPTHQNTQFFRSSSNTYKSRIWLFLTNNSTITRYNLVGYVDGSTKSFDYQYDSEHINNNSNSNKIYTILDDKKLIIEGRGDFSYNDVVKVGIKITESGYFTIGLNNFDGIFTENTTEIYLKDKLLNYIHDIKKTPYTFNVSEGEYNDRFEIIYNNKKLNQDIVIYNNDDITVIKSNNNIYTVKIFDTLGRLIYNNDNINSKTVNIDKLPKGILFFNINDNKKLKFIR